MRRLVNIGLLVVLAAACGPTPPPSSYTYVGRRGDSLAKLNARWGGDAGDYAGDVAAFRAVAAAQPGDPSFAFELGDTLLESGDFAGAAAALAQAHALAPDDEEVTTTFALATAAAGDVAAATETLQELAAARPDYPAAYIALGDLLARTGDFAGGRHWFFEYLIQDPQGDAAAYAREAVKKTARDELAAAARAKAAAEEAKKKKDKGGGGKPAAPPGTAVEGAPTAETAREAAGGAE